MVQRRGFTQAQLTMIFDRLKQERERDGAAYWVCALALWTGARLNEVCQLRVEDVQEYEGIPFLFFTPFSRSGERVPGQRFKTKSSPRPHPLHRT